MRIEFCRLLENRNALFEECRFLCSRSLNMLKEGDKAPDFTLSSDDGKEYSLKSLRGKKVVLYFYPKDDTSGCTIEACGFRDGLSAIKGKNAVVLGVSRDDIKSHGKFRAKYDLNFPLLADTESKVSNAYEVLKEKNMYGKKSIGVVRSTFIIDEQGRLSKIISPVKPEGHEKEVLQYI